MMKIVLATGIYPPDIGGPATYVRALAEELHGRGMDVTVVTYGNEAEHTRRSDRTFALIRVPRSGGPIRRWQRYARALKSAAGDADSVEAFSSVSCGIPLLLSRLERPKRFLRLGGDFLWERYTDRGGMKSLKDWYAEGHRLERFLMAKILRSFDGIVFSSKFQEELYEERYPDLPRHSVIENAQPGGAAPMFHERHHPLRLLFLGRFVGFKNLPSLIRAVTNLPTVRLTLVGEGPMEKELSALVVRLAVSDRIAFRAPIGSSDREALLREHDLLVLPSLTEISPNTALEARASGMPVLLTTLNGLSDRRRTGMRLRDLSNEEMIERAIREILESYEPLARAAAEPLAPRTWKEVADEHLLLFSGDPYRE